MNMRNCYDFIFLMKKILGEKRFGTSIFNAIIKNKAKEEMCTNRLFLQNKKQAMPRNI